MGGFYINFAPMVCALLPFAPEGSLIMGCTYIANSRASTPPCRYATNLLPMDSGYNVLIVVQIQAGIMHGSNFNASIMMDMLVIPSKSLKKIATGVRPKT